MVVKYVRKLIAGPIVTGILLVLIGNNPPGVDNLVGAGLGRGQVG